MYDISDVADVPDCEDDQPTDSPTTVAQLVNSDTDESSGSGDDDDDDDDDDEDSDNEDKEEHRVTTPKTVKGEISENDVLEDLKYLFEELPRIGKNNARAKRAAPGVGLKQRRRCMQSKRQNKKLT